MKSKFKEITTLAEMSIKYISKIHKKETGEELYLTLIDKVGKKTANTMIEIINLSKLATE